MVVDILGIPHAIHITTANVIDRTGAIEAFQSPLSSLDAVEVVLADANYTGEPFANKVHALLGGASVIIDKRNQRHSFEVIPSNPIYGEVIIRSLNAIMDELVKAPTYFINGRLDMKKLLSDFQQFWRKNSEIQFILSAVENAPSWRTKPHHISNNTSFKI